MTCGGAEGAFQPLACDRAGTAALSSLDVNALAVSALRRPCSFSYYNGAPYIEHNADYVGCYYRGSGSVPSCSLTITPLFRGTVQQVCQCLRTSPDNTGTSDDNTGTSAESTGDPHMHSFRGAHYTLLKQGVFVAWNFSKPAPSPSAPPAEWQLLAAYAGQQFTTQGLLLLDPHAGSMEITAEDCLWRIKEENSPWRKADLEEISEDGRSSIQVKRLHEKLGETKIFRSSIMLQMGSGSQGTKSIASLVAHCIQQNHLDFKLTMFDRKDLDYVGGELGMAPDGSHNYHMFSKKSMVQMRADQEFQAGTDISDAGTCPDYPFLERLVTATIVSETNFLPFHTMPCIFRSFFLRHLDRGKTWVAAQLGRHTWRRSSR